MSPRHRCCCPPLSIILSILKAISCMQIKQIEPATDPLLPSFLNGIHAYAYAYACGVLHRVLYPEKCRHGLKSHIGYITAQQSAPAFHLTCLPACLSHCTSLHCTASLGTIRVTNVSCPALFYPLPDHDPLNSTEMHSIKLISLM